MPRTSESSVRPGQDCDSNEGPDEEKVEHDPSPSKTSTSRVCAPLDASEEHRDQSVEHCRGKDAFDCAVRSIDATACLDGVDEAVDFVEALGEDAERYDSRQKLQHTGETEEKTIGLSAPESGRNKAREETSLIAFVVNWAVEWPVEWRAGGLGVSHV